MAGYSAQEVYESEAIRCFTVGDVLVYVGNYRVHPPVSTWDGYLEVARRLAPHLHGLLVVTQGSSLTPSQRASVRAVFNTKILTGVITDSAVTRNTLTALSWFGIPIRGFPPRAYREALRWMKREGLADAVEGRMNELAASERPSLATSSD